MARQTPPTAADPTPRYTVHPSIGNRLSTRLDDGTTALAMFWNIADAERIAAALNRDEAEQARVREIG